MNTDTTTPATPAAPKSGAWPVPAPPTTYRAPAPPKPLQTRRPSGAASWPVLLVAAMHKSGKSYVSAQASTSPAIDRTFWFGFGEKDPDEFGAMPGANFEIVEHNNTTEGLYDALRAASREKPAEGKQNLHVIDSGTMIWEALRDDVTNAAMARGSFDQHGNPQGGRDLWNKAHTRWKAILGAARAHGGPVIITARLEPLQSGSAQGEVIKGQRDMPYDVDAIIELTPEGAATLTGAKSLVLGVRGRTELDWFEEEGVPGLWERMGLAEGIGFAPSYAVPPLPEVL